MPFHPNIACVTNAFLKIMLRQFKVYAHLRQRRSPPSRNLSPRQQLQLGRPGPRAPRVQQHHQTLRFSDLRDQQLVHYQSPLASGTLGTGIYCGTFYGSGIISLKLDNSFLCFKFDKVHYWKH